MGAFAPVKLPGSLLIAADGVLLQLSPVMKPGMIEFDEKDDTINKWDRRGLKYEVTAHCFYKLHPDAVAFLRSFWWSTNRNSDYGKRVDIGNFYRSGTAHANVIIKQAWPHELGGGINGGIKDTGGWVLVSPLPVTSPFVLTALKEVFGSFETRIDGLPKARIKEVVNLLLAKHYIRFSGFDAKGNPNPLEPLVPRIVTALKEPRYPNEELEELLKVSD